MRNPRFCAQAYIGLGSNLDQPLMQIKDALVRMQQMAAIDVMACSSFYRSAPIGPENQPDFVNAVALLHTTLTPLGLLHCCQSIEHSQGRIRQGPRWGPRTLDLDILLYRDLTASDAMASTWLRVDSDMLTLPHPQLENRAFVVMPLLEIAPQIEVRAGEKLETILSQLGDQRLEKLTDDART